ncbi:hypothetical protein NQZ68_007230 [Dissostichus eleginoides]|nr:hypothetical protein NQZ68_007230 [Dissostichus eleginoides]
MDPVMNPSAYSSACHVQPPTPRLCSSVHPRTPAPACSLSSTLDPRLTSSVFLRASTHTCPSLLALVNSGSPAHLVCVPPYISAHLLQPARSRKLWIPGFGPPLHLLSNSLVLDIVNNLFPLLFCINRFLEIKPFAS